MNTIWWIIAILSGFLLGSIMFCEIIPKLFVKHDLYAESPDHNPGAYNAFKICGPKIGIPCVILDVLKGFATVFTVSLLLDCDTGWYPLAVMAPALGHAVGLFNKFKGGKCIATSFGIVLGMIPVTYIPAITLISLYLLFSFIVKINPGSKRSIIVYALFGAICLTAEVILGRPAAGIGALLLALLPILRFTVWKPQTQSEKSV